MKSYETRAFLKQGWKTFSKILKMLAAKRVEKGKLNAETPQIFGGHRTEFGRL